MADESLVTMLNGLKAENDQGIAARYQAIADADTSIENMEVQMEAQKTFYQGQIDDLVSKNSKIDELIALVQAS